MKLLVIFKIETMKLNIYEFGGEGLNFDVIKSHQTNMIKINYDWKILFARITWNEIKINYMWFFIQEK